jgi:hypothetical protein
MSEQKNRGMMLAAERMKQIHKLARLGPASFLTAK